MPPTTLRDWFSLNNRETFTIDPKVNSADAQYYFRRDQLRDRMKKQVSHAFIDHQAPKMMVYGGYGCGKTHTLYYLAHHLTTNKPTSCKGDPHVVHLDIEVKSDATAHSWHLQLMEALGESVAQGWLHTLHKSSSDLDTKVAEITPERNIQQALKQLRSPGDLAFNAWRWLSCQPIAARELQEIGLTTRLSEVGAGDLAATLLAIGNLGRAVGKCLIFFVNEMEALQNLCQGDAAESWHDYLRKLSDNSNSSVGFVLGFKADTLSDAPRIIRQDITSRIGKPSLIELESFSAPATVEHFVRAMLKEIMDQRKANALIAAEALSSAFGTYPFSASSFALLCDYACQDPHRSTPRNIIKTINECAIQGWHGKKRIIDDAIVNEIAPLVFA